MERSDNKKKETHDVAQTRRLGARFLPVLALALSGGLVSVSAARAADEWTFDTILPITGANAAYAVEFKLGFEIGEDAINAAGGIDGHKIHVKILDSQSNNAEVVGLMRQACGESLVVLGPAMSTEAKVAFPIANRSACLAISPSAAANGLTDGNRPWTFAYASPVSVITPAAIDVLVAKLQPKRATVVIDTSDPSSDQQGKQSEAQLKLRHIPVEQIQVRGTDVDFGPAVTRLQGQKPDLVVLSTTDKGALGMLKAMKQSGLKTAILITQAAFTPLISNAGKDLLEGVYRYTEFDPSSSPDPRVKAYIAEFQKRDNGRLPTQLSTQPYDLLHLLKYLIEHGKIGGTKATMAADRTILQKELSHLTDWPSIAGPLTISPNGYAVKPVSVLVFHDGKPQLVTVK